MNPSPPVTMMFFMSGSGSNLVLPVRTGASRQIPVSSSFAWSDSEGTTRSEVMEENVRRRNQVYREPLPHSHHSD